MTDPRLQRSRRTLVLELGLVALLHAAFIGVLMHSHVTPADPLAAQSNQAPIVFLTLPAPASPTATMPAPAKPIPRRAARSITPQAAPATAATAEPQPITPPAQDSAAAETPRPFDIENAKRMARAADRAAARSDLARLHDQWQKDDSVEARLGKDVQRAARPDCLEAYRGAGLLAPLAAGIDILRGKPCRMPH